MLGNDGLLVRSQPIVDRQPSRRIVEPVGALLNGELDGRPPRNPLLGDDLDHPVRRFGAVECGRSRTLDDLDAFDLLWVEVIDARRAVAAEATAGADPI